MSLFKPPRLLVITLAAAGAFAMTACGDESDPDPDPPAAENGEQGDPGDDLAADDEMTNECLEIVHLMQETMEQGRDNDPEAFQSLADDVREFADGHSDDEVVETGNDLGDILELAAEDMDAFTQDPDLGVEFAEATSALIRSCDSESDSGDE